MSCLYLNMYLSINGQEVEIKVFSLKKDYIEKENKKNMFVLLNTYIEHKFLLQH